MEVHIVQLFCCLPTWLYPYFYTVVPLLLVDRVGEIMQCLWKIFIILEEFGNH